MKTCKICSKECKQLRRGMCRKHYGQFMRHGRVLDASPIIRLDKNEIIKYDDYAEIILYNKSGEEINRALIDLEDVDKVKDIRWGLITLNYVRNAKIGLLHRFIMNCPDDMMVDHINHNPLDNRKSNLRVVTNQQNSMNKGLQSNNTSGYPGVYWSKTENKWYARIKINGENICLGYYINKEDAIESKKQAEIKYFGEYRYKE